MNCRNLGPEMRNCGRSATINLINQPEINYRPRGKIKELPGNQFHHGFDASLSMMNANSIQQTLIERLLCSENLRTKIQR